MKTRSVPAGRVALTAAFVVLALALVPVALAGKPSSGGGGGGKGGGGSTSGGGSALSLKLVTDVNGNGAPDFGDTVTFNVSTSASWPSVQLDCFQNGGLVYTATRGFYPTYMWSDDYPLDGGYWTGGAASCTATLYTTNKNGSSTTLASVSFPVGA